MLGLDFAHAINNKDGKWATFLLAHPISFYYSRVALRKIKSRVLQSCIRDQIVYRDVAEVVGF